MCFLTLHAGNMAVRLPMTSVNDCGLSIFSQIILLIAFRLTLPFRSSHKPTAIFAIWVTTQETSAGRTQKCLHRESTSDSVTGVMKRLYSELVVKLRLLPTKKRSNMYCTQLRPTTPRKHWWCLYVQPFIIASIKGSCCLITYPSLYH